MTKDHLVTMGAAMVGTSDEVAESLQSAARASLLVA
jgi:hypothetical protein